MNASSLSIHVLAFYKILPFPSTSPSFNAAKSYSSLSGILDPDMKTNTVVFRFYASETFPRAPKCSRSRQISCFIDARAD